jgi:hypothetical protein
MNHKWKLLQQGQRQDHEPSKALQNKGLFELSAFFALYHQQKGPPDRTLGAHGPY